MRLVAAPLVAALVALTVVVLSPTASSASTATGTELLFYRAGDGAAVTGTAGGADGVFTSQRDVGPFTTGWTNIVDAGNGELLFYRAGDGLAVTGKASLNGSFVSQGVVGGFTTGWTNIVPVGGGELLFYRASDGLAVTGKVDGNGVFTNQQTVGGFAPGWTSIAQVGVNMLFFYRAGDGVYVTGKVDSNGAFTQRTHLVPFGRGWTNIVGTGSDGRFLFYRSDTGEAETALLDSTSLTITTLQYYNTFAKGWTNIVGKDGSAGMLFYRASDGMAETGVFATNGTYATQQRFSLAAGWSQVASTRMTETISDPIAQPGESPLDTMPNMVNVKWYDRSTNEAYFVVQKRANTELGTWTEVYRTPTRDMLGASVTDQYAWTDTDTTMSAQCYRVVATRNSAILGDALDPDDGVNDEQCTVRPDPARFPQNVSIPASQWVGFTADNGGIGSIQTTTRNSQTWLGGGDQTFGVNLAWYDNPKNWQFSGKASGYKVMMGEALAIQVVDDQRRLTGQWLTYGNQSFGVDLQLSSTPSYEWYIVGDSGSDTENPQAGADPRSGSSHALWNSAANAYLVAGDQTFGVNLKWYCVNGCHGDPTAGDPPANHETKTYYWQNCDHLGHAMHLWIRDNTSGGQWMDQGNVNAAAQGQCRAVGTDFIQFTPTSGHVYSFVATDTQISSSCTTADPTNGSCERSQGSFIGDSNGFTRYDAFDSNTIIV